VYAHNRMSGMKMKRRINASQKPARRNILVAT
jgi:hypothetical protein